MTNSDAVRRGLVFRTAPTEALTAGLPGCRCFLTVAAGASSERRKIVAKATGKATGVIVAG
jgi:threonine/homoserine/homoserine lactone efflux protein